jgi:hypothetical protein
MYSNQLFLTDHLVCRLMPPIDDKLGPWLPRLEQRPPNLMLIPQTRMETLVFDEARVSQKSESPIAPLDKIPLERSIRPLPALVDESRSRRRGLALQKPLVQSILAALVASPSRKSSRLNLAPNRPSRRNHAVDPEPPEKNPKVLPSNPNFLARPSVRGPPKTM